ncbi:MAG: hypothetical protein FJ306_11630, partial [Planctomycetes bacterium]|nr:hypothetical protein [Planctomycetota bacterium]
MPLPSASPPAVRWELSLLAALPALALLAAQCAWLPHFVSDDAFISLRYVERLLAGDGLTWTDGERVEGYSNLLWVLGVAGLHGGLGLGGDLVAAARLLGFCCGAAALVVLACAGAPRDLPSLARAAVAPLLMASAQATLGWTQAGLEGPLVLLLLALGFARLAAAHDRAGPPAQWSTATLLRLGVPFALACWTRPDAPLWVFVAGLALAAGARSLRVALALGAPAALAVAAQLAFRLAYYGDTVPNTAHVKAEFDPAAWPAGFAYVGRAIAAHPGSFAAAALAAVALWRAPARRPLLGALLLPVLAWLLYLASVGGDHFPCRRLLHGALAPLAVLVAVAARRTAAIAGATADAPRRRDPLAEVAADAAPRARALASVVAVTALLGAGANLYIARTDAQSHELRAETWEWQGRELGRALAAAFPSERPLLAVDAAGALPFYSGLPCLDLLGLCDRAIATTPLPAWLDTTLPGTPKPPGHLRGNGRYVLDRAPDLVVFGPPPGRPLPVFASGAEAEEDARFRDGYRLVQLDLGVRPLVGGAQAALTAPMWVRLDGRAGVVRSAAEVAMPAWLFGGFRLRAPIVQRYQPPTPEGAAAAGAQFAALVPWLEQRRALAVPGADGRLDLRLGGEDAALEVALPTGR